MTIRGVNISVYPMSGAQITTLDDFKRAYDELQSVGGTGVALNPIHYASLREHTPILSKPPVGYGIDWYIWPDVGQGQHPWPQTVNPDLLLAACIEAKKRNLFVMLKPMVDPEPGGWRGNISVKGNWQGKDYDLGFEWLHDYSTNFIERYRDIARNGKVDALCIGTELLQVTRELGANWVGDLAHRIISSLYSSYPWLITYAANWGWADDAEYNRLRKVWGLLDRTGIDAYFPLVAPGTQNITKQMLVDGWHRRGINAPWCPMIDEDILSLDADPTKLWFTEIGYRADNMAAENPGEDPGAGILDLETQITCWEAFREKWDGKIGAYFAWSWELHPVADPRAHNLRGKLDAAKVALGG